MSKHDFQPMFKELKHGLVSGDVRYTVNNSEHVLDNKTGLEYHLYDEHYKVTLDGDVVFTNKDGSAHEGSILMDIKQMLDRSYTDVHRQRLYDAYMADSVSGYAGDTVSSDIIK